VIIHRIRPVGGQASTRGVVWLTLMRAQQAGVIITISSVAAWEQYPNVAYKATKAGMIALTQQVAIQNAGFGVRANVILPGLIDTPTAVDTRARATAKSRAEVAAARDARVPLRRKMGSKVHHRRCTAGRWRRASPYQLSHARPTRRPSRQQLSELGYFRPMPWIMSAGSCPLL
jgi:NAD(P)-dependent dehydrogenase (short-subunit alcohol dehydrogenase family)